VSLFRTFSLEAFSTDQCSEKGDDLEQAYWITQPPIRLTAKLTALARSKRGLSQFHAIMLRLVGIKVHDDALPDMMMWREVETATAEREYPAGLRV
jgi:hypothetical protein